CRAAWEGRGCVSVWACTRGRRGNDVSHMHELSVGLGASIVWRAAGLFVWDCWSRFVGKGSFSIFCMDGLHRNFSVGYTHTRVGDAVSVFDRLTLAMKKLRLRFSLRTLMLGVIVYGIVTILTQVIGGRALGERLTSQYGRNEYNATIGYHR